jgi:predicted nucleotidyltransferase
MMGRGITNVDDFTCPTRPVNYRSTMIEAQTIQTAIRLLLDAAPGSKVILFGSYARGQADARSDLDFLVVEPRVPNRHAEMVRLRQALRPLGVPVDIHVVSAPVFEAWRDTPNTIIFEAAREGRVYEQVA